MYVYICIYAFLFHFMLCVLFIRIVALKTPLNLLSFKVYLQLGGTSLVSNVCVTGP